MLNSAYRILTDLGAPLISLYLMKRRAEGREDPKRFGERLGHPSQARPEGRLIWLHAASVGEAASVLALIGRLRTLYFDTNILVTTGTVTSARMLASRLPRDVIHQYAPVDRMPYVDRFLDHWQPDFALWIESELWPNMLQGLRDRLIPAALLNGRMSEKSFRNWYRVRGWARELLGTFVLTLTQTEDERARFVALGARPVRCFGNLKYAANPLPYDEMELARLKGVISERPVWLFASTHRGEEEIALLTHRRLKEAWPEILTVIVPRHAARGGEIARMIEAKDVEFARRSKKEIISKQTAVYLADTMGELGLFYRLCKLAVIGGSFVPTGGHNPIEPAQLECAILLGPSTHNFAEIAREFVREQAALQLQGPDELAFTVDRLLANPGERTRLAQAARILAEQKRNVLERVIEALDPWLRPESKRAA